MSLFRKRWKKIPEQNSPLLAAESSRFDLSKSVLENKWFSERGAGVYFGKIRSQMPHSEKARATLPPNDDFVSDDGLCV